MLPFETLGTASTPDGRQLTLHQRGKDYFIYLEGEELQRDGGDLAVEDPGRVEPREPKCVAVRVARLDGERSPTVL